MAGDARRPMIAFVVRFILLLVVGNLLLASAWIERRVVEPWTRLNARASASLATTVGVPTEATGTQVRTGSARLDILQGCNGIHALLILLSSVLAYPAPWSRRVLGVLLGTVAILGFNLVRLVNLIVVARHFPARLELFHIYVWQTLIVLIAFSLFLLWGAYLADGPGRAPAAS